MINDAALINDTNRRAVLRVCHDVDVEGVIIQVQIEPLQDVPQIDVVEAAWRSARRCHPWIVGDAAAARLSAAKEIAFTQLNHLMHAVDEVLVNTSGVKHVSFDHLREAVMDLRGYLPALRGELPTTMPIRKTVFRRIA